MAAMKPPIRILLTAASACLLSATAFADPKDDVLAAIKAQNAAPAYRMKMTSTDNNTKAVTTVTLESVNPDSLHLKTEGGPQSMEVITDGKRTMMAQGGGALQEAPPQMGAMIGQARKSVAIDQMIKAAKDVKVAGHDPLNGVPATEYSFDTDMMGLHATNKLWVSDKDHRPLKSEGVATGEMSMGGQAGQKVDQTISVTYDYDPSIKIELPPAPAK